MTHAIGIERAELLPCPFCGGNRAFVQNAGWQANTFIRCPDCRTTFGLDNGTPRSHADSVAAWNRRAALKPSGDAGEVVAYGKIPDVEITPEAWAFVHAQFVRPTTDRSFYTFAALIETRHRAAITTLERQLATAREALDRQCDNMAFVVNHVTLHGFYEKFRSDLEADREVLRALTPGVSDAE
jgi:hypothetical protein